MCECKTTVEANLLKMMQDRNPDVDNARIELYGYGLAVVGDLLKMVGRMEFKFRGMSKTKDGRPKKVTEPGSVVFTYCPFCGEKQEGVRDGQ